MKGNLFRLILCSGLILGLGDGPCEAVDLNLKKDHQVIPTPRPLLPLYSNNVPYVAGTWRLSVGKKGHAYKLYLKQNGFQLSGVLVNAQGKKFPLITCDGEYTYLDPYCSHLDGDAGDVHLTFREGESAWQGWLSIYKKNWQITSGSVINVFNNKHQAYFKALRL